MTTGKIREIRAQLDAIAPLPEDVTATDLARHLAVRAQERFCRMLSPLVPFDDQQVAAMCAEFAAAHALYALGETPSAATALVAAQIRDAWEDGGGIGEWLWEHLGAETAKQVTALAEEMMAVAQAESAGDEDSGDADDGRVTVSRALYRVALRDAIRMCQAEATNGDPEAPEILAEYEAALAEVNAHA